MIYFFFPETARLTLEEIAKNFGEEVAVHVTDVMDEGKDQLEHNLGGRSSSSQSQSQSQPSAPGSETGTEAAESACAKG